MAHAHTFVARDAELAQLDAWLDQAVAGQGQISFVTGEAGSGKTALVNEFARIAGEQHEDLIVAFGQSDAQTGAGDPYLPFREMLGQLTGDVDSRLAQGGISSEHAGRLRRFVSYSGQALVELGPDLIGIFLPGAGLATRAATYVAEKVGWLGKLEGLAGRGQEKGTEDLKGIDQSHIFEQYTNVIIHLAQKQPLLLVVDDLQWADAASTGLLFRLGRRLSGSRVLLVGTYRPAEVAIGRAGSRHPLEKVLAEFKRYFGDMSIDLEETAAGSAVQFVNAFLDSEPHRLSPKFRQALFDHTDGHPLFTIELLRSLQERGDLILDNEGRWIESSRLDWNALPARVEGVIEERIDRLDADLAEILTVASVEGEDFTSEVVAQVQEADPRQLARRLGRELEKQHRLIKMRGVRRLEPDGRRLSLFRFHHNLIQRYLYNNLNDVDRAYLHEDVGRALEALCGDCKDEFVIQLARHFVEADVRGKAAAYLRRAGELAVAGFAYDEALGHLSRALALTPVTETEARYDLLAIRESVYWRQGAREAGESDLLAMAAIAAELDDPIKRGEVYLRRARLAEATGDYPTAVAAAAAAVRLAQETQAAHVEATGYLRWGDALWHQGEHEEAVVRLYRGLDLARAAGLERVEAKCLSRLGKLFSERAQFTEANANHEQALLTSARVGDLFGEASALNGLAILSAKQANLDGARQQFERALAIMQRIGERRGQGMVLNNLGNIALIHSVFLDAKAYYRQCLDIHREVNDQRGECMSLCNLGAVSIKLGAFNEARTHLEASLAVSTKIGQKAAIGHAQSYLGHLAHLEGEYEQACEHCQAALEIAIATNDPWNKAHSLVHLGLAHEGLAHWAEAAADHKQSLALWHELGQRNHSMEPLAGQARVALATGDLPRAGAIVDEILAHLQKESLQGAEEPLRVYFTCYRVLFAREDPRAATILNQAQTLLLEGAAGITDEEARRHFMEAVPVHRDILFARAQVPVQPAGDEIISESSAYGRKE